MAAGPAASPVVSQHAVASAAGPAVEVGRDRLRQGLRRRRPMSYEEVSDVSSSDGSSSDDGEASIDADDADGADDADEANKDSDAPGGAAGCDDDRAWPVDAVLDHRLNHNGEDEYLVQWSGYRSFSWVPANNLQGAMQAVTDFWRR